MLPYVIINVAMSLNGRISSINGRYNISNSKDMDRVINLRRNVDAILLGANTVITDNPVLNFSKVRIILDEKLKLNDSYSIFDGRVKTYIFSGNRDKKIKNAEIITLEDLSIKNILLIFKRIPLSSFIILYLRAISPLLNNWTPFNTSSGFINT